MNIQHYVTLFEEELLKDTIPFWQNHMLDKENKGVFTSLDQKGECYSTDKSVWMQGRTLYTFATLLNQFGYQEKWLEIANSCKAFLDAHCFDTDGRMYFTVTAEGKPLRKRRYYFSETFYVIGAATLYQYTGETQHIEDARRVYHLCKQIYINPKNDPYQVTPKGYEETRSYHALGPSMIMLNTAQVMQECDPLQSAQYLKDAKEFAKDILTYHYKPEIKAVLENVGAKGEIYDYCPADRLVNPGHAIEAAWFLMALYEKEQDPNMLEQALHILDWSWELGWDKEQGGILYFVDYKNQPVEPLEAQQKLWWPHNETIIACLYAYKLTKNKKYAQMFEQVTQYAFDHFKDPIYGEWYGYLQQDGKPFKTLKGSTFKGPFHHPRMCVKCLQLLKEIQQ